MPKKNSDGSHRARVLVLVDESNVGSSVRTAGRGLDWIKLRDFLAGPATGRDLIEMVVYAGCHRRPRHGRTSVIRKTSSSTGCARMDSWS
jgi:hypothetical protein